MLDYAHTLGDAVKRARGKSGLTQSEVADAANVRLGLLDYFSTR